MHRSSERMKKLKGVLRKAGSREKSEMWKFEAAE